MLESLQRVCLGLSGAGSLHILGAGAARDSALASGVLFLGLSAGRRHIRRAGALRRSIVVNPSHVVKEIPAAGKAISRDGAVTTLKEAEVRVVSVAVESMGLAFMAEQASIRRKMKLSIHTAWDPAAVRLQMGIQVFAF